MDEELRELGREWVETLYNMIEAEDAESMPHDVTYQGNGYRRLNRKTRNAHVATLFGTIELRRYGYRYWQWDYRGGLQNDLHTTPKTVWDALEQSRCSNHSESARDPSEWRLEQRLPGDVGPT